ncbi:MAG: hypothetical protein ABL929_01990, partial [Ferruginibacter sp.]
MAIFNVNKLLKPICVSILCLMHFLGNGQNQNAIVDKKDILIGEQIVLTISSGVSTSKNIINVQLPNAIPHFEIINDSLKKKETGTKKIIITSFDSGSFTFPALPYTIKNGTNNSDVFYTDSFKVNVGYMPMDNNAKSRDIKTIIPVEYINWLWVFIGIAVFGFLLFLILYFRYLKKQKQKTPQISSKNVYKDAMNKLAELKQANEKNSITVKEYHTTLALIFKTYYSHTSKQNILNITTNEILKKLQLHQIKAETALQANEALQTGDATKFAKYNPSYAENETALNYVKNIIEELETLHLQKT